MESTRAEFLIRNSEMSDRDKDFLVSYIRLCNDIMQSNAFDMSVMEKKIKAIDSDEFNKIKRAILIQLSKLGKELDSMTETTAKTEEEFSLDYCRYKIKKVVEFVNAIDLHKLAGRIDTNEVV